MPNDLQQTSRKHLDLYIQYIEKEKYLHSTSSLVSIGQHTYTLGFFSKSYPKVSVPERLQEHHHLIKNPYYNGNLKSYTGTVTLIR